MDDKSIIKMYVDDDMNLREISRKLDTNHKLIARILRRNNIEIIKKKTRNLTEEHKKNIGDARRRIVKNGTYIPYNKGLKMKNYITKDGRDGKLLLYHNMISHLKVKIDLEWLLQFTDIDKLKYLNRTLSKKRNFGDYSKQFYIDYINKFYYDKKFNDIYNNWISNNCEFYLQPSPDHIIANTKGGEFYNVDNIQFLTWFENRCKNNISQEKWNNMKKNIEKYFI